MPAQFELKAGLVVTNENGQAVTRPGLSAKGLSGTLYKLSLSGQQEDVDVPDGDGGTRTITYTVPTPAQLQDIYDSSPAFVNIITPADGHTPPWA